MSFRADLFR